MRALAARAGVGVAAALACLTAGAPPPARASGFASAEFAGEHGNVVETNPTALYFNPAGIGFSEGTNFFAGGVLALRRGSWSHALAASEVADPPGAEGADTGQARFSNLFGAPVLGGTARLRRFALGAAFYVPFGGRLSWDQNPKFAGDPTFGQAVDGVQRWTITHGALTYLYFTAGGAVRLGRLSVGVTGNVIRSAVQLTQAKSFNPALAVDPTQEGRIVIDVSGTQVSFGAGAMLEAIENRLWLGVSYQAQPGLGPITLHGTLDGSFQMASMPTQQIDYTQALPDIIRAGARLRAAPAVEVRVFGDLTRWSRLKTECLSTAGHPCLVFPSGADASGGFTISNLRRNWNDTFGVRAGASWWMRPTVELYAGAGFETAAAPAATIDPALPDLNNVRVALGGRVQVGNGWRLGAGLTDVQYFSRDNTGKSTLADAELPTRRADGGGKYTLWLGLINVSIEKQL
jgi:long-chain fatty acid transport protein